jgi:hypothetical protein
MDLRQKQQLLRLQEGADAKQSPLAVGCLVLLIRVSPNHLMPVVDRTNCWNILGAATLTTRRLIQHSSLRVIRP